MNQGLDETRMQLLRDTVTPERVFILDETTKDAALRTLIGVLATSPEVSDRNALETAVFKREELMSTGIGLGLAVPHVRIPSVSRMVMAVGISPSGIGDYNSLDDKPVHLVFLIAAPEGQHAEYLRLLSAISAQAKTLDDELSTCRDVEQFYTMLTNASETRQEG
jgi:PTS system nitrogen regulatory IIA component